jgi:hypothetical protein
VPIGVDLIHSTLTFIVPHIATRQAQPCFLIGNSVLPAETQQIVETLVSTIECDTTTTTIGNVPDVHTSSGLTFSSINFATSSSTPLQFALDTFTTSNPVANSNIEVFQQQLDVYLATEAGVRSESGNLALKLPKFFLAFQVARIKTAKGIPITDPGQTVEHLLGKVMSNGKGESKALLDQVQRLATQLV